MCCFSGPVRAVSNTRIFARLSGHGTQFLVYQMQYQASRDLAMILPVPIQTLARETSVRFINLQKYPKFFDDMELPFIPPPAGGPPTKEAAAVTVLPKSLVVHSVGNFSASFVPTLRDFERLDKRFVLPPQIWAKIPAYRDFGFAVFKLKAGANQSPSHPMAFEFRTRFSDRLFLPTVHIHDGLVHATETFDHALYVQDARLHAKPLNQLRSSYQSAAHFMNVPAVQNLINGKLPCFKREIVGTHVNRDLYISLT